MITMRIWHSILYICTCKEYILPITYCLYGGPGAVRRGARGAHTVRATSVVAAVGLVIECYP